MPGGPEGHFLCVTPYIYGCNLDTVVPTLMHNFIGQQPLSNTILKVIFFNSQNQSNQQDDSLSNEH